MLVQVSVLDRTEISHGLCESIQVRYIKNRIIEDSTGEIIREGVFWRCAYSPGDDLSHEDPRVQALAALLWTPEVVAEVKDQKVEVGAQLDTVDEKT